MTSTKHSIVRRIAFLCMAAALTAATACHTMKNVPERPVVPDTSQTTIPQSEPLPNQKICEKTVMTFTATVDGISVNGQLRMATDSIIWVSVTKLVELGRAMATPDSVWVNVPLANKYFKGNYHDISRRIDHQVSFHSLQKILEADNPERQIERLASQMGFDAKVRITRRQKVERISFPFVKP